uniref:Uncharacterized protein n=1 Tax=Octopus bimaculoides TaxID=37653 RepID=A0A0L8GJI4_OCTBM
MNWSFFILSEIPTLTYCFKLHCTLMITSLIKLYRSKWCKRKCNKPLLMYKHNISILLFLCATT